MDSKTHMMGGTQFFSIFVIILWYLVPSQENQIYFPIGATVMWFAWLILDQYRIKLEQKKERGQVVEEARFDEKIRNVEIACYSIIIVSIIMNSIACDLICTQRFGIILIGYLLAFLGASVPDLDLWISIKAHRNPFTHSGFIISLLFLYFFFGFEASQSDSEVLFMFSGFLIGYSSHLLFDIYPQGSDLLKIANNTLLSEPGAPGDIRKLPEKFERGYLTYGSFSLIGFSIFLILRILSATQNFPNLAFWAFPAIQLGNPIPYQIIILLLAFSMVIIFPISLLLDNWGEKEPKKRWNWIFLRKKFSSQELQELQS